MEYEYLFTKNLHEKLKEKVKGKIFCKVINDILVVDITTREGLDYGYTLENFAEKTQFGLESDNLVTEIINGYKKKVLSVFFY